MENGDLEKCLYFIKEMLQLSMEIKTISLKNVLSMIIEEGFEVSSEILKTARNTSKAKLQDVEIFATQGLELSTLLHGASHSVTEEWRLRKKKLFPHYMNQPSEINS